MKYEQKFLLLCPVNVYLYEQGIKRPLSVLQPQSMVHRDRKMPAFDKRYNTQRGISNYLSTTSLYREPQGLFYAGGTTFWPIQTHGEVCLTTFAFLLFDFC